tara:strand:- start:513 stop:683 length:171 start_codon:yes stop_codon:yes gene_type:complete
MMEVLSCFATLIIPKWAVSAISFSCVVAFLGWYTVEIKLRKFEIPMKNLYEQQLAP